MKKTLIPWRVFRDALQGQHYGVLETWLARWGFTNDGVVLLEAEDRLRESVHQLSQDQQDDANLQDRIAVSLVKQLTSASREDEYRVHERALEINSYFREL
jgi:hypothetical protein